MQFLAASFDTTATGEGTLTVNAPRRNTQVCIQDAARWPTQLAASLTP